MVGDVLATKSNLDKVSRLNHEGKEFYCKDNYYILVINSLFHSLIQAEK